MAREDYQIIGSKPVGRGAFGTVFAARRIHDDAAVALKIVLHSGEWGAERIDAERKGAILQERFAKTHGMVPEVYDCGPDGDDFYIAMAFVDGPSLESQLRLGPLCAEEAAGHALWLCGFLEKAHAFSSVVEGTPYRVVHTDLKPAHLMIPAFGERRVLDFGIAKALEESRELGTDIGRTIAYAAPERLVSDQVNPHADFWSLGVMLYEMVCGHRPYPHLEGPRFRRELEHAITSNAQRVALPGSCAAGLKAIINKLLAFQVEHRYSNAEGIRGDLEAFLRGEVPSAVAIYETPATTPVKRPIGMAAPGVDASPATTPRPASQAAAHATPWAGSDGSGSPATTPRAVRDVPATDVRPRSGPQLGEPRPGEPEPDAREPSGTAGGVRAVEPASAARSAAARSAAASAKPRSVIRHFVSTVAMTVVVFVVATEGVAWLFAERFREAMATVDERTVTDRRLAYAAVDRWALLDIGLRLRVHSQLRPALISVGDRVIADYRREEPSMGPSEWTQAYRALTWARELSSRSAGLRSKQLTAEGHVQRFEAQAAARGSRVTLLSEAALAKFREAAAADPESLDPYLGMARIQVYALSDVDGAAASIAEAEKRGYAPGRREAALLGDGYLRRALATRRSAAVLTGDQKWRELTNARADFERCVVLFDPIVAFGNAAANLEKCKAQLVQVERQLDDGSKES